MLTTQRTISVSRKLEEGLGESTEERRKRRKWNWHGAVHFQESVLRKKGARAEDGMQGELAQGQVFFILEICMV